MKKILLVATILSLGMGMAGVLEAKHCGTKKCGYGSEGKSECHKKKRCGKKKGYGHCPASKFLKKTHALLENKDKIGLSPSQVEKIKALQKKVEKSKIQKKADSKIIMLDIRDLLSQDEFDITEVNRLIAQKARVMTGHFQTVVQSISDVRSLLSKGQKSKLKKMMKKKHH